MSMSKGPERRQHAAEDTSGITELLETLSLPATDKAADIEERSIRTALVICLDGTAAKWGPRWLTHYGLEAVLCDNPDAAVDVARSTQPDVVIVESGLQDGGGTSLVELLQPTADFDAPLIVMCANARELPATLDTDAFDVIRKPYEWRLVALRAKHAAEQRRLRAALSRAQEKLAGALIVADDVRRQLRSRESFEPVTGLPNRKKFVDLVRRTMTAADRDDKRVAVFVIGFNRFRLVVEAMGQERADLVLTEIGSNIDNCLLEISAAQAYSAGLRTAAAASIDHARFAMMLTCSCSDDELAAMQSRLIERLSRPVQIAGQTVYLSACVGAAIYPQDAADVDSLLQRAKNAMRDAQSRGGGFRFYSAAADAAAARKLKLEHMLHEALETGELSIAYQPIIDVALRRTRSAEALLRWHQPAGESIRPSEFVPIAEESGLMDEIGEYVLEHACRQLAEWNSAGHALSRICVNVSKAQLMGRRLVTAVTRCLQKYRIDPASLELELSERGVLSGNQDVVSQLHELKSLGVRLSLDDFGTGDSAIIYLRELPIDVIKIDQSYIQAVNENRRDAAIVSAMVALGQQMGLKVIAEGVETAQQLAAIERLGCDEYQGFLVSEPVPASDFPAFLTRLL